MQVNSVNYAEITING